jgi:lysozyme family protein
MRGLYSDAFLEAVRRTLQHEGGTVNDPVDRGGRTRQGITEKTLSAYNQITGHNITLETMDHWDVLAVYHLLYWRRGHIYEMPKWAQSFMFDWMVHSGPWRAVKLMQQAIGEKDDGIIGPKTLAGLTRSEQVHGTRGSVNRLAIRRMRHLCGIVQRDSTQSRFIKGWWRRVSFYIS